MDVKKRAGYGLILLAAFTLVCSAASQLLFARADTFIYGVDDDNEVVYTAATPTNTQTLSMYEYRSATPVNTQTLSMSNELYYAATPVNTQTLAIEEKAYTVRFGRSEVQEESSYSDPDPVYEVQPVMEPIYTTQPVTGPVYTQSDPEPVYVQDIEPIVEETPTAPTPVEVAVPIITNTTETGSLDAFLYNISFMSNSGGDYIPVLPADTSVAMLGGEISTFQNIRFEEPGQYFFKIEQERSNNSANSEKGYAWNDTWFFVGVTVAEGAYGLEASVTCYQIGSGGVCTPCGSLVTFNQSRV